jgi:hypothetical protein
MTIAATFFFEASSGRLPLALLDRSLAVEGPLREVDALSRGVLLFGLSGFGSLSFVSLSEGDRDGERAGDTGEDEEGIAVLVEGWVGFAEG